MIALVGAMFVSVGSVRAAGEVVGQVSSLTAVCIVGDHDGDGGTTPATAYLAHGTGSPQPALRVVESVANDTASWKAVTSPSCAMDLDTDPNSTGNETSKNLNRIFKVTPNGTDNPIVELQSPSASIRIANDSDGTVADGVNVDFAVSFSNFDGYGGNNTSATNITGSTITITDVLVSGELDDPESTSVTDDGVTATLGTISYAPGVEGKSGSGDLTFTVKNPKGTTAGKYTVTVKYSYTGPDADGKPEQDENGDIDGSQLTDAINTSTSLEFFVGDAGTNTSAAVLTLGNKTDADAMKGTAAVPETGSAHVTESIWLRLTAQNSLDALSNKSGLTGLTVLGVGADIELYPATPDGSKADQDAGYGGDGAGPNSASVSSLDHAVTYIKVSKSGAPAKPGSVDLWAQLIGKDGAARSETITVSFTGSAQSLVLGTAPAIGQGEKNEFTIDAEDAGGSAADVGTLSQFTVTGPDGKRKGSSVISVTRSTQGLFDGDDNDAEKLNNDPNQVTGQVAVGAKTPPGEYTVSVGLHGVKDSAATTVVTVTGPAANVDLNIGETAPDMVGQSIEFTATVTDESGNLVADGIEVVITASDVRGDGDSVLVLVLKGAENNSGTGTTEDGVVAGRLVVVGDGTAVITATSGSGFDHKVVTSTAGVVESDAMPEEEASVSCLSELSGFATWSCGVEADASEIFDMVSGRGVTALHLWNGSTWVRYSVVDGAMVPGSSDFMVTENDILYISN